jgi:hypothetical protein
MGPEHRRIDLSLQREKGAANGAAYTTVRLMMHGHNGYGPQLMFQWHACG